MDTGATNTILSTKVYEKLFDNNKPTLRQRPDLRGAGDQPYTYPGMGYLIYSSEL